MPADIVHHLVVVGAEWSCVHTLMMVKLLSVQTGWGLLLDISVARDAMVLVLQVSLVRSSLTLGFLWTIHIHLLIKFNSTLVEVVRVTATHILIGYVLVDVDLG